VSTPFLGGAAITKLTEIMTKSITFFIKIGLCAIVALGFLAQAQAATDPTGTWSWTTPGRNGGPDRKTTLKLKLDGEKVTGTISSPGRNNAAATDTDIKDGKMTGDEISFSVTREFNGNSMTTKYSGKVTADTIKGKIESERNGQTNSRDWEAKKDTEKK